MKNKKLQTEFTKAVEYMNTYTDLLPADLLLKLYAYYKIANKNYDNPGSSTPLINAFKANALIQARKMSRADAMKSYIKLVKTEVMK
ncbi:acyl-CoA-binding protein [Pricia sp. S334]|uniref:Acyl-CoA-binding protein n=1 Tax=Pricia mediterranea TaxID=3076079 RepID=A0ABU3L8L4_9FLAO|nr:acyl-CoA-binding protein [Pricia sp. S334]MDT7829651.1 acyl-CoA-binding protein [Pricia sp. S334]